MEGVAKLNVRNVIATALAASLLVAGLPTVSAESHFVGSAQADRVGESTISSTASVSVLLNSSYALQAEVLRGTIMVPARKILTALGYDVKWDAAQRAMSARQGAATLRFTAGEDVAQFGGNAPATKLPVAPYLAYGTLFIPLRATAEAAGLRVVWDGANHRALVTDPNKLPELTVMTRADNGMVDQPDALTNYFKSNMGINVTLNLVMPDNYVQKNRVMIAAGDMTPLMLLQDNFSYNDVLMQSFALDITNDLKAFPRLQQWAADSAGGRTIGGRVFGLGRPSDPHDASFPALNQDWMAKLGLAQPTTMEDLYAVMKRFSTGDPDGNGKNDTYGLTGYVTGGTLGSFAWVEQAFTGSPTRFSVRDGHVIDHAVSTGEADALAWLAKAYGEGLIDQGFDAIQPEQAMDRVRDNRVGVAAMSVREAADLANGGASWVPLSGLRADARHEPIAPWNADKTDTYVISSMSRVEPKTILSWLDQGLATNWTAVSGLGANDRAAIASLFGEPDLAASSAVQALNGRTKDAFTASIAEWNKISYADEVVPALAQVGSTGKYADLDSGLQAAKLKVITGETTLDAWKQYTTKLVASPSYQTMMTELANIAKAAKS